MWQVLQALMQFGMAKMAQNSARRAGAESARGELQEGESAAKMIRRRAKEVRGSASAAIAASGVDVDSPTAQLIDAHIAQRGEEDALAAFLTGKRRWKAAKEGGQVLGQQYLLQAGGQIASNWIKSGGFGNSAPRSSGTMNSLPPQGGYYDGGGYNA